MKTKRPELRRKFHSAWDEIAYLHGHMLYSLMERCDRARAARFSGRLGSLLAEHDPACEAILGAACRALIAEAAGDLWTAIRARERELELIDKFAKSGAPAEVQYAADEVSDRMDLLAGLYWESGNLSKAEEILRASKQFCALHRIAFDGQEMLRELKVEQRALRDARPAKRAS
jgi:hypothetical protein